MKWFGLLQSDPQRFFFLQFHSLILGLIDIRLYNLFWFIFYGDILVLWSKFDRLTQVDSNNFFVFCLIDLFINFILQYLVDWEFSFMFLLFTFCGVMMVSWPGSQVLWVSQIGSGFFLSFFNWIFFSILIIQHCVD
jgi:hypothetical protein